MAREAGTSTVGMAVDRTRWELKVTTLKARRPVEFMVANRCVSMRPIALPKRLPWGWVEPQVSLGSSFS